MRRKVKAEGVQYNLLYDPKAIRAVVKYLAKHNPNVKVDYAKIMNDILKSAEKNAGWAREDRSEDGKWAMSYTGTAGYLILFSMVEFSSRGYPVIEAEVYVTPNIGKCGVIETKFRN